MANLRSSKKDLKRTEKRRAANLSVRTSLKTFIKKTRVAAAGGDEGVTKEALASAISAIDKAVQRGIIHKNQAARRKSRVAKAATAVAAAPAAAAPAKAKKASTAKGSKKK